MNKMLCNNQYLVYNIFITPLKKTENFNLIRLIDKVYEKKIKFFKFKI